MKTFQRFLVIIWILGSISFQIKAQQNNDNYDNKKKDWIERMQDPDVDFKKLQEDFYKYWNGRDDYKGNGYKIFRRWEYINEFRILPDGKKQKSDQVFNTYEKYKKEHPKLKSASGAWSIQGPTTYVNNLTGQPSGMGRINAIAFDPTDVTGNTIFIGSPSGGFWKTTNHGTSWTDLSANVPTLGVSSILIHPSNPDIIYLGTGDRDANDAPGMGVFKSTDGGASWIQMNRGMGDAVVGAMLMLPSDPNTILAATNGGIFKTTNGGISWSLKSSGNFKDIKFKPGDPNIVYAVKILTPSEFYRSTNTGDSWTQISSGISTSGIGSRMVIGVSEANPNYVYLVQIKSSDNTFAGLLQSTDSGSSFSTQSTSPNICGYPCDGSGTASQATYDLCITVDPSNANTIYVGSINNWKSTDGGVNWTIVSHWVGTDFDAGSCAVSVHADQHWYEWNNGKLYVGNDGGLYYTEDNGATWPQITNNLAITQIYKIGQSVTETNYTLIGCQDNGSGATTDGGNFTTVYPGDGAECIIDYSNTSYCYVTSGGGVIKRTTSGPVTGSYTNVASKGNNGIGGGESATFDAPFMLHETNPNIMFAGYSNVYRCDNIKASPASAVTFSAISTGESSTCYVLEQSPADVNILYAVRSGSLKRTDNANDAAGSVTWTTCALPDGSTPKELEAHSTNANIVYAVAGYKVYKSTDKGATWTDISGSLPDLFINTIVMDKNSNEGLYIGNQTGVFYKNATMADWAMFSDGLPLVDIRELEIYYDAVTPANNRIKAATYGRGLWQSDLIEINVINPSTFAANAASSTQINLSWAKNGADNDVLIAMSLTNTFGTPSGAYTAGDAISGGGTVIYKGNASNFNHASLNANSTYYYKIWSVNGSNQYSAGLPSINAKTDCNTITTLPFTEDFEGANCFRMKDNSGEGLWQIGTTTNINLPPALNGNYAYFKGQYNLAHNYNTDLISPTFDLTAYPNVLLQFSHLFDASNSNPSTGTVYYSIDNGSNWNSITSYTTDQNNTAVSFNVNAVAGQSQVKFKWNYTCSPLGAFMWAVDDIQISDNSNYWTGATSTNWFTASNWSSGVPTSSSSVVIPSSPTNQPQINAAGAVCSNISINSGASLTMNNSTAYTLQVSGDWTNNGTFTRGNGTVEFNGTNDLQTIKGSSTTNFYILKVTKGAQNKILEATSLITLNASSNPLILNSGTFKLSSASTIKPFTTSVSIGSVAGFWNNGGTIEPGGFSWTINQGLLRTSAGITNIGTNSGNGIIYLNSGQLIIEGGELNIAGRLSPNSGTSSGSYTQSGGTITLNTVGSTSATRAPFEISPNVPFTMSNGTIVIQNSSSNTDADFINFSTTNNVTGGTLQIGNASTHPSQTIRINSTAPLYNLLVNSTSQPIAKNVTNGLTVLNDVAISGGTLDANNLNINVGGNWINNGVFLGGTGTVTLNGSESKTISGSSVTNFKNLILSNGGYKTIVAGKRVSITGNLTTNNLLKIDSDALGNNGSLIVEGTSSGNVTYNRFLLDNRWFITSGPLNVTSGFNTLNGAKIKPGSGDYDFAPYVEAGNAGWNYLTSIPSLLTAGKGYITRLSPGNTSIEYTGTLNSNVSISLPGSSPIHGWNAIGNPYTSAIKIQGDDGFITTNISSFTPNYAAIYLWNDGAYRVISNNGYTPVEFGGGTLSDQIIQVAQGFLVNIPDGGKTVNFTKGTSGLQVHDVSTTLKSGEPSWPGITLAIQNNGISRNTIVCFNSDMTTGLDVSFDAGLFSSSKFDIYTKIVSNNSDINLAIQCLPDFKYGEMVVPVGIKVSTNGIYTFKASGIILSENIYPILEDRLLNKLIPLKSATDSYAANLDSTDNLSGRFYLHFADENNTTAIEALAGGLSNSGLSASYSSHRIIIFGNAGINAKASIFDINGRKISDEFNLSNANQNEIPAAGLVNGVYFVRISGKSGKQVIKVPVVIQ